MHLLLNWLTSPHYRLIALLLMMPSLSFGAKPINLNLPPYPKTNARKDSKGNVVLGVDDYTAWIDWARLAKALPGKCYASLQAEKDKAVISLRAGAGRCAAEGQVVAAQAIQQNGGVPYGVAMVLTVAGILVGAAATALTLALVK